MHKQQPRQKKGDITFDVTMGSYDGAETCELRRKFPPFPTAKPQHQHRILPRRRTGHFQRHTERYRKHQKGNTPHL